ncbi:unnamed protein product [Cuscuta epithymum]|uniref:Gnk2-homologous domain-containing protein n=1 Tax=Cuscuta epithymum TaxID=186058 RepID=A0AAV0BWN0_9ASTE|nr:unnamed protein product [Cuscuta epithymum]
MAGIRHFQMHSFLFIVLLTSLPVLCLCSKYRDLVFRGCGNQKLQDQQPGASSSSSRETLKTLFETLISQSATMTFSKATVPTATTPLSGLFQCRGDLSHSDCQSCVEEALEVSKKKCGYSTVSRIQLVGCYLSYNASGFDQADTQFLFKKCGEETSGSTAKGFGFGDSVGIEALEAMAEKVVNGFYEGEYGNGSAVKVLVQCEQDLRVDECKVCLNAAIQSLRSSCGAASSYAQLYLQKCFISYTLKKEDSFSPTSHDDWGGVNLHMSNKKVAIFLGGSMAVVLVICLVIVLTRSCRESDTPYSKFTQRGS